MLDPAPSTSSTKRASSSSNAYRSRRDSSPASKTSYHSVDTSLKLTSTLKSVSSKSPARRQPPASDHQPPATPANRSQILPHKQPVAQAPSQPPISTAPASVPEPRSEPRQVFIRRVQAVVEIPVKDEDADDDLLDHSEMSATTSISASTSGSGSGSIAEAPRYKPDARRYVHPKKANGRSIVQSDDEDSGLDDDFGEIEEELDPSEAAFSDHSEEDDELIMGAEVSRFAVPLLRQDDQSLYRSIAESSMGQSPSRLAGAIPRPRPPAQLGRSANRQHPVGLETPKDLEINCSWCITSLSFDLYSFYLYPVFIIGRLRNGNNKFTCRGNKLQ